MLQPRSRRWPRPTVKFRVVLWGLGFGVWGLGFGVWGFRGLGFRV